MAARRPATRTTETGSRRWWRALRSGPARRRRTAPSCRTSSNGFPGCGMRQAGFEPTTFGSGGGTGQRPPTLAVVVSGTYASRASASASQRRPRCYHRCYRGSLLRRCVGAAPPCTCIRSAARDGEGSQRGVPAALHQRVQQFLRVSQVGGVEPLSEPIVDRCEHVSRLVFLPWTLPQART